MNPVVSNSSAPTQPGQILSIRQLGRIEAPTESLRAIAVYYLMYWSTASGGSRIAAKLFIPEGNAPATGWPVTVWCHGLGDPAMDFRRWPFQGGNWQDTRGQLTGRWAHYGYVTLTPWLPGGGESEPLMSYSPLSLPRNAQAVADGFLALQTVQAALSSSDSEPIDLHFDHTRQVLRTDCVSTPLLIYFAAHRSKFPGISGLKAFVADDFQPSVAYNIFYLNPYLCQLPSRWAAAMRCIWSRNTWALAREQHWPLSEFFSEAAIQLFEQPLPTPVGLRDRIFASKLVPPQRSELAPLLESAVTASLNRSPTGQEIQTWMYSTPMLDWMSLRSLDAIVNSPFYQRYYAASDPFFAETITPFNPGIPLLLVARTGEGAVNTQGLPSFNERYLNMTLPKVNTLRSWGWTIEVTQLDPQAGTSFSGGMAQQVILKRLHEILA